MFIQSAISYSCLQFDSDILKKRTHDFVFTGGTQLLGANLNEVRQ